MTKYESLYEKVQKGKLKLQDILKDYSITSDSDGTWIVVMKAKTEKHYDVPVLRANTLNDAIDKIFYFDHGYNRPRT
tara:strand:- start:159 stop:389 length:231 start_codon:yes stop_codon:yes gene_type:complete